MLSLRSPGNRFCARRSARRRRIPETSTGVIAVTLDQAKIARLPAGATTLIIGNPMIADVTMLKNNNSMVITGKGFGQTNLIAIDAAGSVLEERQSESSQPNGAGPAEWKLSDILRLQPGVHAHGAARRRRQDVHGSGRTDHDSQQLRRGRRRTAREVAYKRRRKRASAAQPPVGPLLANDQAALAEVLEMGERREAGRARQSRA